MKDKGLQAAATAFGLDSNQLIHVGGNVNAVYQYPAQHGFPERILRLSNQQLHSEHELLAEIHFMKYLFDHGVSVPEIFLSKAERMVENVADGCYASVFSKAPGRNPIEEDWNPRLFVNWGRIIGQMHLLTQSYKPPQDIRRRDWKQEPCMDMLRYLPEEESTARLRAKELLNWLESLPIDVKNYGLVHADLHQKNIFVTGDGSVTAFDFDDSCYHWFAYDIALILYLVILRYRRQDTKRGTVDDHVAWFLDGFLKGYQQIQPVENWWLQAIPKFMSYRRLNDYSFLYQRYDWKTVDGELKTTWLRMKDEIEADEPLTNFQF